MATKLLKSVVFSKFAWHKERILGEFDLKKDSQPVKLDLIEAFNFQVWWPELSGGTLFMYL